MVHHWGLNGPSCDLKGFYIQGKSELKNEVVAPIRSIAILFCTSMNHTVDDLHGMWHKYERNPSGIKEAYAGDFEERNAQGSQVSLQTEVLEIKLL